MTFMIKKLRMVASVLAMSGIDVIRLVHSIKGFPFFVRDYMELKRQKKQKMKSDQVIEFGSAYPCLGDRFAEGGDVRGHYFHQDLLVARRIYEARPEKHVDIGSRVDGFVAHVASFREVEVLDIRPFSLAIQNIKFVQCDLMDSKVLRENYTDSLSCLHALEHFGLGRYGDPVNYDGHIDGFNNLKKILRKNGIMYLSVPIGPQRIEFNGHRVFSIDYLLGLFGDDFLLKRFSYVDDKGYLHENELLKDFDIKQNFGCYFGCGIFELEKK